MIDREKIIKGVKTHVDPNMSCEDCSYWRFNPDCFSMLWRDVAELLEEQTAMPVDTKIIGSERGDKEVYCCRACRFQLDPVFRFCPNCGKEVIWND